MKSDFIIEYIKTKADLDNVKINNFSLHSMYNPKKEARQFVERNYKIGHSHILFGYGCGYIVDAFLEKLNDEEELIVIEPILNVVNQDEGNFKLITSDNIEDIKKQLKSVIKTTDQYTLIISINYDKIAPQLLRDFLIEVKELFYLSITNENTINAYGDEWQRNYIFNLENTLKDQSLSVLYKKIHMPVVIASGGPSLTKQIPLIRKYRDSIMLISAGSTINTLINEGIEPDFIVSIDGNIANYSHFEELYFKNARFIYLMSSYPKIRNRFENSGYYLLGNTDYVFEKHLTKILNEKIIRLPGGGSVANYALAIANYLSDKPIALIGQDLAYTDNKSHASNNKQYHEIDIEKRLKTGAFYTQGYYGEPVLTDYSFLGMKRAFESLIQIIPNNTVVFNCTEGGIQIDGFQKIPLLKFLENFCDTQSRETLNFETSKVELNKKLRMVQLVRDELEVYKKLKELLINNINLILSNKSNTVFSTSILRKLEKNDLIIQTLTKDTCISTILDPINIEVLKKFKPKNIETLEQKYNRIKEQNLTLYRKTMEAVEKTGEYLKILIERIQEEVI